MGSNIAFSVFLCLFANGFGVKMSSLLAAQQAVTICRPKARAQDDGEMLLVWAAGVGFCCICKRLADVALTVGHQRAPALHCSDVSPLITGWISGCAALAATRYLLDHPGETAAG